MVRSLTVKSRGYSSHCNPSLTIPFHLSPTLRFWCEPPIPPMQLVAVPLLPQLATVHCSWWQSPCVGNTACGSPSQLVAVPHVAAVQVAAPLLSSRWQHFIPGFVAHWGILSQLPVPPNQVPCPTHFHGVAALPSVLQLLAANPPLSCQQSTSLRNSFKRNVVQHTINSSLCFGWNNRIQRFASGWRWL